jgi:uncharacterized damage-inducible protein DinB
MQDFFKELFQYNYHMNWKLIDMFLTNRESVTPKSLLLASHIINAHNIWNSRILSIEPAFKVWEEHSMDGWAGVNEDNYNHSLRILDTVELDKTLAYNSSKGEPFSNTVRDILFHVVNHSNYHRAQIATEFKGVGITPLTSDYIFYKR